MRISFPGVRTGEAFGNLYVMEDYTMRYDVIIIGAGPGGIFSARSEERRVGKECGS